MTFRSSRPLFGFLFLAAFLAGCTPPKPPTEETFYYWKTQLKLSAQDQTYFTEHHIQRLYVRYFDLDWDSRTKKVYPRAPLQPIDISGLPAEVVPVVYITTEGLAHLKPLDPTARIILQEAQRVGKMIGRETFPEIQMDADWTPSTREAYFGLLTALRQRLRNKTPMPLLSATIRLHQVKYRAQTGVPPVDRGILMNYHTSSPQELNSKNSILDEWDAKAYLRHVRDYPLPLDLAFSNFSWGAQFNQNGRFLRVFRLRPQDPVIEDSFAHLEGPLYQARADIYLSGLRFMKDDYLKVETSDRGKAKDLMRWIQREHPNDPQRVIWFEYSGK